MSLRRDLLALLWGLVRVVIAVLGWAFQLVLGALRRLLQRVVAWLRQHPLVRRADASVMGTVYDRLADPHIRQQVEELFSRRILGSVLIAATTTRTIEVSVGVAFGAMSWLRIPVWIGIWTTAVAVFVWWEHIEERAMGPDDSAGARPTTGEGDTTSGESDTTAGEGDTAAGEDGREASSGNRGQGR